MLLRNDSDDNVLYLLKADLVDPTNSHPASGMWEGNNVENWVRFVSAVKSLLDYVIICMQSFARVTSKII